MKIIKLVNKILILALLTSLIVIGYSILFNLNMITFILLITVSFTYPLFIYGFKYYDVNHNNVKFNKQIDKLYNKKLLYEPISLNSKIIEYLPKYNNDFTMLLFNGIYYLEFTYKVSRVQLYQLPDDYYRVIIFDRIGGKSFVYNMVDQLENVIKIIDIVNKPIFKFSLRQVYYIK